MERVDPLFLSVKFPTVPEGFVGRGGWICWLAALTPALCYIIRRTVTCLSGVGESSTRLLCSG